MMNVQRSGRLMGVMGLACWLFLGVSVLSGEARPGGVRPFKKGTVGTGPVPAHYKDDPNIVGKLKALSARTGLMLPKFKIMPKNAADYHWSYKNGPYRRDFCNKLAYAPDRGAALYCGANHNVPHRLNDVWEFHLGSNTWTLILPPANDATYFRRLRRDAETARKKIAKGQEVEKNKALLKAKTGQITQWHQTCTVADGYLQARGNGGPVRPWHTWDGVTYDQKAKRLYWAELDSDNFKTPKYRVQVVKTRDYAKATGQDPEALIAKLKPSSSMFMYDPAQGRWFRQMGKGPFPVMRAMGGSLTYLPDQDKTIWYCAATNIPGGEFAMWAYDAKTNTWADLKPNGGIPIRYLAFPKDKKKRPLAPRGEVQIAYSAKHKKMVAVWKEGTFVYDVVKNAWSRGSDNPGFGWDSLGVFAYDDHADVFLLFSKKGGVWSKNEWNLAAYDVEKNTWEVIEVQGAFVPKVRKEAWLREAYAGYYDSKYNALVLYLGRGKRTWVYRHAK